MKSFEEREAFLLRWLLDGANPAVRYRTLLDVLARRPDDPEVRRARTAFLDWRPIRELARTQRPDGHWGRPEDFYWPKYKSTFHVLWTLAEIGYPETTAWIDRALDAFLERAVVRGTGAIALQGSLENGGRPSAVTGCTSGYLLAPLLHFRGPDDPRVAPAVRWLARTQDASGTFPCFIFTGDREKNIFPGCFMGAMGNLKALARIPPGERTADVRRVIARAVEAAKRVRLFHYRKDARGRHSPKPTWTRFRFPTFYSRDALDMLNLFLDLGVRDPDVAGPAVELVRAKRTERGWLQEADQPARAALPFERKGRPSRWVTMRALRALRAIEGAR